jgi:hypothetical protein
VGTVSKVNPGKELFLNIKVHAAADLSRLEEVLVVTEKQEREAPVAENGSKMRAADILAQRLPSVPDKPVAAAAPGKPVAKSAGSLVAPLAATAKPQPSGSSKLQMGIGTAGVSHPPSKPAPAGLTPANTTSASPIVDSGTARTSNGSQAGAPGGTAPSAEPNSASDPAKSATKPADVPVKPTTTQPNLQPPITEDNPH